jgi:endonuclease YncB( thermonuclease family)
MGENGSGMDRMNVSRMRLSAAWFLVAALFTLILAGCSEGSSSSSATRQFVEAARAMTGDSLEAFLPERTAVAVIGVEAPQGNTDCGRRAREFVAGLIQEGVTLEQTPPLDFDATGRKLFHAFTVSGQNIGLLLLQEGLAKAADVSHKYQSSYVTAEEAAQSSGKGCVWAASAPSPSPVSR